MQFHQNFESQLFDIRLLFPPLQLWKETGKKKGKYIYIYITEAIFLAAFLFGGNLSCYLSVLISAVSVVRRRFTIRHPFRRRCKEEIDERGAHATCALRKKLLYKEGKFDFREVVWFFFFPLFLVCRLRTRVLDREKNDYGLVFVVFCFF